MADDWSELIERYADGRKLCNCRQAYYDENGQCKHGCQANQYNLKDEIARRVLEELAILDDLNEWDLDRNG
jgi:hypothetical protein